MSSKVRSRADLEAMPEKKFDEWLVSTMDICQCLDCATHNECAKKTGERLFCVVMRSPMCIETKKGCLCSDCTVARELGFKNAYHCLNGAELIRP